MAPTALNGLRTSKPTHRALPLVLLGFLSSFLARAEDPADFEFFERRIRPVLADRCYSCHSQQSEKLKGGLKLDSLEAALKGGDTQPAIVPGQPDASLLIKAVRYEDQNLLMPPKGRLTEQQINDLVQWVKAGAKWPNSPNSPPSASPKSSSSKESFDLSQRAASHWSWRPIQRPALPPVRETAWPRTPVDHFILHELEKANLPHAPQADARTLIRRLYFDLIGLPPSPEAIQKFTTNPTPEAYERLVDTLLASPRFGERWGRHWLDLVRYAETLGHEFDFPRHNAWRYRDYVIRALNQDVPYDQFVLEHLAGDQIQSPRFHPADGSNESLTATGFYWFGQQVHSPVDLRIYQSDVIDNQIDVLSKSFLGLTVACARCHDHKFDAISTRDFYSLYGILSSSRYTQTPTRPQVSNPKTISDLRALKVKIKEITADAWIQQAEVLETALLSALTSTSTPTQPSKQTAHKSPDLPTRWSRALAELSSSAQTTNSPAAEATATPPKNQLVHALSEWYTTGTPKEWLTSIPGDFILSDPTRPVSRLITTPGFDSGLISDRLQGSLRSKTFVIETPYLHILASGKDTRFNVVIDNFTMIQAPIYGGLRHVIDSDQPRWFVVDLSMWQGHRAFLEFLDTSHGDPASGGKGSYGPRGVFGLSDIRFSQTSASPSPASDHLAELAELIRTIAAPTNSGLFASHFRKAVSDWRNNPAPAPSSLAVLGFLTRHDLLPPPAPSSNPAQVLSKVFHNYRELELSIPESAYTPSITDGNGLDEVVFIRGNPKTPGTPVARRFLEALAPDPSDSFKQGSGRAEFAQHVIARENPFTARVMANRVWLHLFGRGIVPTPDDFGVLGQPPTHPALLDWIADYFRSEARWSVKQLIRTLVLSSTYKMASENKNAATIEADPQNLLFHRMSVKRLEAESIRDSILAITGDLNLKEGGPSVPTHLTPFMDGRGRPPVSGPLNGDGRRSIYLEVRNNFLTPMMRTFDSPIPFTTVGRRTASNVPAQSLILMNDPFVKDQARSWASRILRASTETVERIQSLFHQAYGRQATPSELSLVTGFLRTQAAAHSPSSKDLDLWSDLCHVILNGKELIYIP